MATARAKAHSRETWQNDIGGLFMKWIQPLCWLIAIELPPLFADDVPPPATIAATGVVEEFSIERDGGDFLAIPVKIGGDKFTGIIDTGSSFSVIDRSLRRLLGTTSEQHTVHTPDGTRSLPFFEGPEVELGRRPVKVKLENVTSVDLSAFRRFSKLDFQLILGMDVLKQFAIKLDFPNGRGFILDERVVASSRPTSIEYHGVGRPWIVGECWEARIWFLIDTGSLIGGEGALSREAFELIRKRGSLAMTGGAHTFSLSGPTTHRTGRLRSLVIANRLYTAAEFHETDNCHIGLAHLSRYCVTLDFPNNLAYFDSPAEAERDGPLASLGLVTTWQDDKLVVAAADTKSRTTGARIRVGDHVVAIDGIAFRQDAQPAPPMLSSERSVALLIERQGSRFTTKVTPASRVLKSGQQTTHGNVASASNTRPAPSSTVYSTRRSRHRRR
jgi:hypothetical protein